MKLLSVAELARLPWNSPVEGVVGIVQMVHTPLGRAGWSLQNGRLVDESGNPMVEFMLSKHARYWDAATVKGKRVELYATQADDLVWKEQKAKPNVNRGQPFAKLEVAVTTRMVFAEAEGSVLPGFGLDPGKATPAPVTPSPAPALPVTLRQSAPEVVAPQSAPSVAKLRTQLRQMLGLHMVVERVVREEARPEEQAVLLDRLFAQACSSGLFQGIDPEVILLEMDPAAFAARRPQHTRLGEMAKGKEDMLNLLLRGAGVITMDQTWQDLSETEAEKVLQRAELVGVFAKAS